MKATFAQKFCGLVLAFLTIIFMFLIGLVLFAATAKAATAPPTLYAHVKFTWTAPTVGCSNPPPIMCDNVVLVPVITGYDVFFDTKPIPDVPTVAPTVSVAAGVLTANVYPQLPQGTVYYARVRARNGDLGDLLHTGALTAQVSAQIGPTFVAADPVPGVPGAPTVSVTYSLTP